MFFVHLTNKKVSLNKIADLPCVFRGFDNISISGDVQHQLIDAFPASYSNRLIRPFWIYHLTEPVAKYSTIEILPGFWKKLLVHNWAIPEFNAIRFLLDTGFCLKRISLDETFSATWKSPYHFCVLQCHDDDFKITLRWDDLILRHSSGQKPSIEVIALKESESTWGLIKNVFTDLVIDSTDRFSKIDNETLVTCFFESATNSAISPENIQSLSNKSDLEYRILGQAKRENWEVALGSKVDRSSMFQVDFEPDASEFGVNCQDYEYVFRSLQDDPLQSMMAFTEHRTTLLHAAAYDGCEVVVDYLIKHGADVNARESNGQTPLHFACSNAHLETIRLLLKHGAGPDCKDCNGEPPSSMASKDRDAVERALEDFRDNRFP